MKGSCFLVFEEKTKKKKKPGQKTGQHDEHLLQSRRERKTESKAKLERQGDAKKHEQGTFLGPLKLGATSVETNPFTSAAG